MDDNKKIQLWERKLLDLSMANDFINMKLGKAALPFDGPDIEVLEDELEMRETMHLSQPELTPLYRAARANMEESGANTLFLTLGSLNWCGCGKSGTAPILLLPVELIPTNTEDEYILRKRDDEIVPNVTLTEFLSYSFGVNIPAFDPLPMGEHGVDVMKVIDAVRTSVAERTDWKVTVDSYLGLFSFSKFVMWSDIHNHKDKLMSNEIVRSLIEGRLLLRDVTSPADARRMDKEKMPSDIALPVDADSSQLEAVVECAQGRSFILYGPPGTGKSQTITNMIANSLYCGKRVLFVAQKKAALDVVYNRLKKIGLGPFCLEMHSNKVEKKEFLQQMNDAINVSCDHETGDFKAESENLYRRRMELNSYVESLHRKQDVGYSLHECINCYLNTEGPVIVLSDNFITTYTRVDVESIRNKFIALDFGEGILGVPLAMFPLHDMLLVGENHDADNSFGVKMPTLYGDTVENMLTGLPQILDSVAKQIDRNKNSTYVHRTVRQYLEMDYKWKKFIRKVDVPTILYEDFDLLRETVSRWIANVDKLPVWREYCNRFEELRTIGLGNLVDMYLSGLSGNVVADIFMKSYYRQVALHIIKNDSALNKFNGIVFQKIIDDYKILAKEFQLLTRNELVAKLCDDVQRNIREPELSEELTLLRRRIGNAGRGNSVRSIIGQMPNLLKRLCPCMLMSPLSVAQYIDVDSEPFDVVIFDEASQMPTPEAVGALARAKAAVIVGDPNQMPPTSFFTVKFTSEEESDLDDQESILDDCIALSLPSRYLGWHYRSKHESLIAFCNTSFYGGNLVTFPSVDDMVSHVSCRYVDGIYENSCNKIEAQAVVDEIITRLKHDDGKSIGVVAFSKSQSDVIESLLYKALKKHPELDAIDREREEPVFVKNLENVQGDERDVILFSIGYGPDSQGKLPTNFGPLRLGGGERRLNVAVSRSRYEMVVFSSLHPEQIDERKIDAKGVVELKKFITFAEHGKLSSQNISKSSGVISNRNHMIQQLVDKIRDNGYEVRTAIGSSAFKVDIAVVNPNKTSEYLLGILCDGQGYYQLKTTRDRELVRPSVLSLLGWNLLHVWSIDWLNHPQLVIDNILSALKMTAEKPVWSE